MATAALVGSHAHLVVLAGEVSLAHRCGRGGERAAMLGTVPGGGRATRGSATIHKLAALPVYAVYIFDRSRTIGPEQKKLWKERLRHSSPPFSSTLLFQSSMQEEEKQPQRLQVGAFLRRRSTIFGQPDQVAGTWHNFASLVASNFKWPPKCPFHLQRQPSATSPESGTGGFWTGLVGSRR